jgi:hypothetical protein
MSEENPKKVTPATGPQRFIASYDDGYEHSVQHYAAVTRMLEESETERGAEFAEHSNNRAGVAPERSRHERAMSKHSAA